MRQTIIQSVAVFVFLILVFACKKDKLEGNYAVLKGRWELAYIVKMQTSINGGGTNILDTIYPIEIVDLYVFEFLEKGKLRQLKNDILVREDRIVFESFSMEPLGSYYAYYCSIKLNNKDDDYFVAGVNSTDMSAPRSHVSDEYGGYSSGNYNISYQYIYHKQ